MHLILAYVLDAFGITCPSVRPVVSTRGVLDHAPERKRAPRLGRSALEGYRRASQAQRERVTCCLEDNLEAELQRAGGAQCKHARAEPNQVRTVAPRRAVKSSRRSVQDAAKRLAWRVEVLAVEEIVDANLRLDRQAVRRVDWLELPSELQVKGEHVAEALRTRRRSRNRRSDRAER